MSNEVSTNEMVVMLAALIFGALALWAVGRGKDNGRES